MTTFFLIRHGHNDLLEKRKLAGRMPNVHLSAEGHRQAEALVQILPSLKIDAIYASPLERAIETAEPLARAMGLEIIIREGLLEIGYGSWQGQSLKALRRRKLWPILQNSPSLARFPEGESFPEAQARVVAELEALRALHRGRKGNIACVFHSDPIKLAIAHYLGLPLDLFQRITISPASISVLAVSDSGIRIMGLNDTRATFDTPGV
ncbi:MAG TPA: histidine phosphatase family protein [Anaerolineales bacterium]|nr:histidine phosphatase family protein [Anaerolineales bacterium]